MPVLIRFAWLPLLLPALGSLPFHDAGSPASRQAPAANGNNITLLALNQPPCATPSRQAVLVAKLAYRIAAAEQSEQGFAVSIKFQTTEAGRTFSSGPQGHVFVAQGSDTLTLRYPVAAVWNHPRLKRPLTCYFYLHRYTAPGRSTVIAQTPAVVFAECQ
ncbi:hypothetical protein GCM10027048_01400 [Hymenobacter coalescens]